MKKGDWRTGGVARVDGFLVAPRTRGDMETKARLGRFAARHQKKTRKGPGKSMVQLVGSKGHPLSRAPEYWGNPENTLKNAPRSPGRW